jgi:hypothetical protein
MTGPNYRHRNGQKVPAVVWGILMIGSAFALAAAGIRLALA